MSYQAVIRDAVNNQLVSSTVIGMQISILQGSATGTPVYKERHFPTSNTNGLVSLEIGTGIVVSGDFTTIDWANGTYFIKIQTDLDGGTNYTITGTTPLLSVPYALHAKTAESITGTINYTETDPIFGASIASGITAADTANWNKHTDSTAIANMGFLSGSTSTDNFYLGQDTLDGIVYYIYKDATGTQHGLIVNKTESTAVWQATATLTNANRTEDGAFNTALMTNSAAANYVTSLGTGWYLPSIDELNLLYYNRFTTNKALRAGGFTLLSSTNYYWSSTEYNTSNAFFLRFNYGYASGTNKSGTWYIRAVRAF